MNSGGLEKTGDRLIQLPSKIGSGKPSGWKTLLETTSSPNSLKVCGVNSSTKHTQVMRTFLRLAGKTDYSTHVVVLINNTLIHYTWGGVVFTKQDYLLEPVWVVDLHLSELEYTNVIDRALTLKEILPRGFGHWWFKAFLWLFNRNQYLCTNFVCSCRGYTMKVGITPDELYTWLSKA